jgi:hypothetical protein
MTDPKRWLEDQSLADSLEARVLAAGAELEPPENLVDRSFASFAALVGTSAAPATPITQGGNSAAVAGQGGAHAAGAFAGKATLGAGVLKALGLGALLGTLTMSSAHYLGRESPPASPQRTAISAPGAAHRLERDSKRSENAKASAPAPEPVLAPSDSRNVASPANGAGERLNGERPSRRALATADELSSKPSAQRALSEQNANPSASSAAFPDEALGAQATPGSSASPSARNSALKAEAMELARAKNLLQQGHASEALTLLAGGSARFANGVLGDERELLTVQALSSVGRRDEAQRRARAFLSSHAEGSISLRMQRLLERL